MKKFVLVLVLAAVLSVSAFAEHPDGWGIGPGFQYGGHWNKDHGDPGSGLSLFLKAPMLPIYWGISLSNLFDWQFGTPSYFGIAVTGDYFIIDKELVSEINLGWFLGVGGYFQLASSSYKVGPDKNNYFGLGFGARVPVGLYWVPLDFLEVFLDLAPSVGLYMGHNKFNKKTDNDFGLGGGWQVDFGVRFWL